MAMPQQKLVIIGAGEFGREVYTWANQAIEKGSSWSIKGFLDDRTDALKGLNYPHGVISSVEKYQPESEDVFLCAVGSPASRKKYCEQILERKGNFTTLVHPTALIGPHVKIGIGSIICPLTQLSCEIEIGRFVTFGTFSAAAHDTMVGDWCQISGHCGINGRAILEEGVFLGSHSVILPGVRVGAWSYVGAGSVVLKRVRPGIKVFGNPAVVIEEMKS